MQLVPAEEIYRLYVIMSENDFLAHNDVIRTSEKPTYTLMNIANQFWKTKEERDCKNSNNKFQRKVFNEPTKRSEMDQLTQDFEEVLISNPKDGAIFQGVCRGKVSEGQSRN